MRWRWVAAAFLLAFLMGGFYAFLSGQEIRDSIEVTVLERPSAVTLAGPGMAYKGDRLTYMARVVDADGNPTLAFLVWSVSDTSKAQIVSLTDSTATVQVADTGSVTVRVRVGPLDSLRVGMVDSLGVFHWPSDDPDNTLRLAVRETAQACALFFSGSVPWAFSSQEICYPAYRNRYGLTGAPAGPLERLAVYGHYRAPPGPGYLAQLADLIRASPPAKSLFFFMRVL